MADIQLSRPAANQTQTVTSAADARFVLNFPTGEAKLAKSENGENLILTFDDGAKIEVEGFYTTFNKDSLPTLNVGGQDISGEQLAAVLGEDLMPAAGPASAAQAAQQGGRFRSFADADLNGGIDRLGGLDIGFDGAAQQDDSPDGYYALADEATVAGEVTPEPTPAPTPTPTPTPTPSPEPPVPPVVHKLTAQNDPHGQGIMNTLRVGDFADISNDTLGSVAAASIAKFGATSSTLPATGVSATFDESGNALTLTLDSDLEKALYASSKIENAKDILGKKEPTEYTPQEVNRAYDVHPVGGRFEVDYTAQDSTGEYTGTATATFTVGDNKDTMQGGGAPDVAWVRGNTGLIETGGDADLIVAMSNDKGGAINAGEGADKLYLGSTAEGSTVDGGAGNDTINVSRTNAGEIYGGDGKDVISIYENAGAIDGGSGNDTIDVVKGSANDAGKATNSVYGGAGIDSLVLRGGSSYMNGDDDGDVLKVQGDNKDHRWSKGWDNTATQEEKVAKALELTKDFDAQYATLVGGAGNDTLKASDGSHHNVLYGDDPDNTDIKGNDRFEIFDVSHDNTVYGGGGQDAALVMRWAHKNVVYGGDENNDEKGDELTVKDWANNNALYGGMGKDTLIVQGQSNMGGKFIEEEVRDVVWGTAHHNKLYGGEGDDSLLAQRGAQHNLLDGDGGKDTLSVLGGSTKYTGDYGLTADIYETTGNTLRGGEGGDELNVSGSQATGNLLEGGADGDSLYAQDGASYNKLYGDDPNDSTISGGDSLQVKHGAHHNTLYGGAGKDTLVARNDNVWQHKEDPYANALYGDDGEDILSTYWVEDTMGNSLYGGADNDTLYVEDGSHSLLDGGRDNDQLTVASTYVGTSWWTSQNNTLLGGEGNDTLMLMGKGVAYNRVYGDDSVSTVIGDDHFTVQHNPNETLYGGYGYPHDNTLYGGGGNDKFTVTGGNKNTFYGDGGEDRFTISGGTGSTFYGGAGNDLFSVRGGDSNTLDGGEDNDTFDLYSAGGTESTKSTFKGGDGNDLFVINAGAMVKDHIHDGGEGLDLLVGYQKGVAYASMSSTVADRVAKENIDNVDIYVHTTHEVHSAAELKTATKLDFDQANGVIKGLSAANGWTRTGEMHTDAHGTNYVEYQHVNAGGTVDAVAAVRGELVGIALPTLKNYTAKAALVGETDIEGSLLGAAAGGVVPGAISFNFYKDAAGTDPLDVNADGSYRVNLGSFTVDAVGNMTWTLDPQAVTDAYAGKKMFAGSVTLGETFYFSVTDAEGHTSNIAKATLKHGNTTTNMEAGDGADVIWIAQNQNKASVECGDGNDIAVVYASNGTVTGGEGDDLLMVGQYGTSFNPNRGLVDGGAGSDTIGVGQNNSGATLRGGEGADSINTDANVGLVEGNAGNDTLTAYRNRGGTFDGGADDDYIKIGQQDSAGAKVMGGDGNDTIYVDNAKSGLVEGNDGNDHITAFRGYANFDGGAGNDYLGITDLKGSINGGDGNDVISVGWLTDRSTFASTIDGGEGIDFLIATRPEVTHDYLTSYGSEVNSVEVMLKGKGTSGLNNLEALKNVGIEITGENEIFLSNDWKPVDNEHYSYHNGEDDAIDLQVLAHTLTVTQG